MALRPLGGRPEGSADYPGRSASRVMRRSQLLPSGVKALMDAAIAMTA